MKIFFRQVVKKYWGQPQKLCRVSSSLSLSLSLSSHSHCLTRTLTHSLSHILSRSLPDLFWMQKCENFRNYEKIVKWEEEVTFIEDRMSWSGSSKIFGARPDIWSKQNYVMLKWLVQSNQDFLTLVSPPIFLMQENKMMRSTIYVQSKLQEPIPCKALSIAS